MISKEYPVSDEINDIFCRETRANALQLAELTAIISEASYKKYGEDMVLVSLARAGSPVGVLMKRYLKFRYNKDFPHYSISIIREKGIDENAISYILDKHPNGQLAFIDGWTGKGSITHELKKAVAKYNSEHGTNIDDGLIVLADPAKRSKIYGTRKDICIPNACLNSTVSGLVSRTIHNEELIGKTDFHGAKFFGDLIDKDYSNWFIETVAEYFAPVDAPRMEPTDYQYVDDIIKRVADDYGEGDITRIKLSIGETSRALLRRIPKIMLIKNEQNPNLEFVIHLANEKGVPIEYYDTGDYECISVLAPKNKMI